METRYTKQEIKQSEKFKRNRDLIEALLKDGIYYTTGEVLESIERFMEGCV